MNKREEVSLKQFKDPKTFIEYSNDSKDYFKSIEENNTEKDQKVLIMFINMTTDMVSNKHIHSEVTEFFIRGTILNISLAFITQSYV